MTPLRILETPEMKDPTLLIAFAGWSDAGGAATAAAQYLIDRWHAKRIAEIEAEDFYDFTQLRPTSHYEGDERKIVWPQNVFHHIQRNEHDFIIFKRELVKPKQVYTLDDSPIAVKDAKESGVVRNGRKVTVKLTSLAPALSLREFKVKKGDEVTLILTNLDKVEDLTHGFAIPHYHVNFIVNPQETKSVTFVADKPGVFWAYCTHFCHALHLEMRSRMIVEA